MSNIPNTLDEAIQFLVEMSSDPSKTGGMGMRNSWGLWSGSKLAHWFYSKKIYHADDMSAIISESYKRHLNGQDRDLNAQIEKYHKHWEQAYGSNHLTIMKKHIMENIIKERKSRINMIINQTL